MEGLSLDSKFYGEKNANLIKMMKTKGKQAYRSSDMSGELAMKRRAFKVSPQVNIETPEINFIDFNKRMSPLSRILGKDKNDGQGSFRS